jgi:type I restriction enzyme, S subunit
MSDRHVNRYAAYKESGVEWIGEMPAHWVVKRIKDMSTLQSGISIVSEQIEENGEYPVYGGNGLRGYYSRYTNNGNYILIGRQGALCGNINYASGKFWASEHAVVVYLNSRVNIKWYGEMLRVMNLNQHSIAAAQPGLAVDRIKRLLLPVPPLPEQKAIAACLDTKTAQIDRQIELLSKKAMQYGKLKQSLINETVTRGLDSSVPMKESGIEWIGEVPAHWEVKRAKDLFKKHDRKCFDHDDIVTAFRDGQVTRRLNRRTSGFTNAIKEIGYQRIHSGDLVIHAMDAFAGAIGVSDSTGKSSPVYSAYSALDKQNTFIPYYGKLLREMAVSGFISSLGKGIRERSTEFRHREFAPLELVLPPLEEQTTIAAYLDTKTAQIDRIVSTINTQIDKLKELRKTLINDVVTGKIKVIPHGELA